MSLLRRTGEGVRPKSDTTFPEPWDSAPAESRLADT
jgi:hypothetical protein